MTAIYKLIDPRNNQVQYVGKSDHPQIRRNHHCTNPCSEGMRRWVEELAQMRTRPVLAIIEWCDVEKWEERETFWVAEYRRLNPSLLNVLGGGDGCSAEQITDAMRAKISAAHAKRSPESRLKTSTAWIGRKHSPEARLKMSIAALGRKFTPDTLKKLSIAKLGKRKSDETRARMREARKNLTDETRQKIKNAITEMWRNRKLAGYSGRLGAARA